VAYPRMPKLRSLCSQIELYTQLEHEYGARGITPILNDAEKALRNAVKALKALPVDKALAAKEPDDLAKIRALRPCGPRRIWRAIEREAYADRLEGALLGRFAGCTLGAIVEGWPIWRMEALARENGDDWPPTDYWSSCPDPKGLRYDFSRREDYTRGRMKGVPVDDDLAYTLLGLLIVEDFGPDFTVEDVGKAWLKYLPYACTAEDIALKNLKKGVPAAKAATRDNPFCEWIGADIRSDPWGYLTPGWPEMAAEMAWRDAYVSHRRQGIYGEMFFSAAIAAAFAVDTAEEAFDIALTEIPKGCTLAKDVRWALKVAPEIKDYRQARDAVDDRFAGMSGVHTINNGCLTIWGLTIGGRDFTKVIGETVAMGLDNDCTGATAGSIAGALVGKSGIPEHWYRNFDNTVHSYLIRRRKFSIDALLKRFAKQARKIAAQA
jgi:ADP-ribosylglycohydrolase